MKKPEKKQIGLIVLLVVIAIVMGSLAFRAISGKKDYTISTTLPICAVTEKTEQDGIYCLTVQLED